MKLITELPPVDKDSVERLSHLMFGGSSKGDMFKKANNAVRRQKVLITGAGGSIGGDLCRRMSASNVEQVVMLDVSEAALYQVHKSLDFDDRFIPVMADIRDVVKIDDVMRQYLPNLVLHAAALKHVHMLENPMNMHEAVKTNIIGTHIVASTAAYHKAALVMISTDKAVNPNSILGLTKRIAELVVAAVQHDNKTHASVVRFGNVMNSSGSAIPLFKSQIAAGKPVTITDMNMTRFMMTLGQATELVLAASGMKSGLHVLDMGAEIKIVDLATMLIRMADKEPITDVPIIEVGIRPGEKLREELFYPEELEAGEWLETSIFSTVMKTPDMRVYNDIQALMASRYDKYTDGSILALMRRIVPEYTGGAL